MLNLLIVSVFIFCVSVIMTMVGKGGGNFYVVILAIANIPMYEAAATGQFILFTASVAAMFVFRKNKFLSWNLAIFIGIFTGLSAFIGGYFSHLFGNFSLKLVFSAMLFIAGAIMLIPVSGKKDNTKSKHFGTLTIKFDKDIYSINLWITLPITILTGFASGMVGVSGGSFLVPLMVLACGVSMHTAVGTASALIAATAFMGFVGHAIQGDFNPRHAILFACVAVMGGVIGGKFSLKSKPRNLKKIFAYTNWIAAFFMILNAFHMKGMI